MTSERTDLPRGYKTVHWLNGVFFCILLLRAFWQHIYSYFQYLNRKEDQRKQYNDLRKSFTNSVFTFVCHASASARKVGTDIFQHSMLLFCLQRAFTCNVFSNNSNGTLKHKKTQGKVTQVKETWMRDLIHNQVHISQVHLGINVHC